MKHPWILIFIALSCATFVLVTFVFHFSDQAISDNIAHWASFGSYFGGIVGPVLSFFALIASITALYNTQTQLRASRDQLRIASCIELSKHYNERINFHFAHAQAEYSSTGGIAGTNIPDYRSDLNFSDGSREWRVRKLARFSTALYKNLLLIAEADAKHTYLPYMCTQHYYLVGLLYKKGWISEAINQFFIQFSDPDLL